jgi:hypothetical protein
MTGYGIFIVLVITTILCVNIATSSIGIACYKQNNAFAEATPRRLSNKKFLVWMNVGSVLGLILTGVLAFFMTQM